MIPPLPSPSTDSYFFFLQGFEWEGDYIRGQQPPSPDGAPQGFVRCELNGQAGEDCHADHYIAEYVDGKLHGHYVVFGWDHSLGEINREYDFLRGRVV